MVAPYAKVPSGREPPCIGYLRLSPPYEEAADQPTARGWRVERLNDTHLDPSTKPDPVAKAITGLFCLHIRLREVRIDDDTNLPNGERYLR